MSTDFALILAEMQADFLDELPERCDRIEERVMAHERGDAGAFDELYRQVHSLKGSGGTFNVPLITTICHQFESFLSETPQRMDRSAASAALAYVDLLRKSALTARDPQAGASVEQALERLRTHSLSGRKSVLLIEPSEAMRKLCKEVFAGQAVHLVVMDSALQALERLLHEPFDLMVASREQSDLNAVALVAALRESGGSNRDLPVILVSSNPASVPAHLRLLAVVRRDPMLGTTLARHVAELLARRR